MSNYQNFQNYEIKKSPLGVIFQLFNIRYQKIFNNENALWYIPKGKVRA